MYYFAVNEAHVKIPPSSQNRIIFPQNLSTLEYDVSNFDTNLTDNRISSTEIEIFFSELDLNCDNFSQIKNGRQISKIALIATSLVLIIGIILAGIGLGGIRQTGQVEVGLSSINLIRTMKKIR